MSRSELELVLDARAVLGEGPTWDARDSSLLWVDIDPGIVHRYHPDDGRDESFAVGQEVGAVVPRTEAGYVLAVRDGFGVVPAFGAPLELIVPLEADRADTRMNDGKADPAGRLWAGTLSREHRADAALYRLDPDHSVRQVITGVTTSNGLGWSPDGTRMYYIDTGVRRVDCFDYDLATGTLSGRTPLVEDCPEGGAPDGMTVDADGCLWVAFFGGWCLRRYTPDGRLDREIPCPVSRPTSCAFGGADLRTLYITCDSRPRSGYDPSREPHAGGLFALTPGVSGLPTHQYAG